MWYPTYLLSSSNLSCKTYCFQVTSLKTVHILRVPFIHDKNAISALGISNEKQFIFNNIFIMRFVKNYLYFNILTALVITL